MVSYTTVVLVFLIFMVAMIGGVDLGLAKLVDLGVRLTTAGRAGATSAAGRH